MERPHLPPVPGDGGGRDATRTLPNHRARLDVQIDMLSTFARLSGGHRAVSSEQVADALKIGTNTVSLSCGFFVDSGWLERRGREEYVATEPLVAYHRLFESRPGAEALTLLARPVRSSWYWQVLEPNLRAGSLSRYEAAVVLATDGNTALEHRPQLDSLLEWLDFLELIEVNGDEIVGSHPAPSAPKDRKPPAGTAGPGDVVIALDIDLHLTAADLAVLSPDQIRALFEAMGTVASLTRRRWEA